MLWKMSPQGDRNQRNDLMNSKTKQACYGSKEWKCLSGLFWIWWLQSIIWDFELNTWCEQVHTIELGVNKTSSCINKKFWDMFTTKTMYAKGNWVFFKELIDSISKSQRFAINVVYKCKDQIQWYDIWTFDKNNKLEWSPPVVFINQTNHMRNKQCMCKVWIYQEMK